MNLTIRKPLSKALYDKFEFFLKRPMTVMTKMTNPKITVKSTKYWETHKQNKFNRHDRFRPGHITQVWRYIPEPICMYTYISNPIGQPTTAAHFNLPKTCIFVINPKQVIFDKNQPHRPASIKMLFSKKILKIFYNFISNY